MKDAAARPRGVEGAESVAVVAAAEQGRKPGQPLPSSAEDLAAIAGASGLQRIHILAWRDLDDPEAGGSEVHAAAIATAWAAAGIDITLRASTAVGHPASAERDGYRVIRKAGRYTVFPRTALSGFVGRTGPRDGLVEVWNGMPFFSPLWVHQPSVVFLHHVHAEMWRMVLKPAAVARVGEFIEYKLAPPVYRRSRIVTLSPSSKEEIIDLLGLPADHISVVPPGIDTRYSPGGTRSPHPLVVAVGRLVPVKRFPLLIDALIALRTRHPDLEAIIVGEGYDRPLLEAQIAAAQAQSWLTLPGRVDDEALVDIYRRAWVLASASRREGWGMTLTEAAACGTPAVVTDIAGHRDALAGGQSGILVDEDTGSAGLSEQLDRVIADPSLRARLGAGALAHAAKFTWAATARGTLETLATEAVRREQLRSGAAKPLSRR